MKQLIPVLCVFVLVFMSACGAPAADRATSSGNAPAIDFTAPAEPLNVTVTLDDSSTASEVISLDGGSISLTAADGSVYTLEVPAGAVSGDTLITMTAVKSLDGAPLDSSEVAGVQLEPSGSQFKELLTLTVVPSKDIPPENQIMFAYEGSGQDYHLAVVDPKSKDIKIKLMNFSGAGVGSGSDAEWAANLRVQASDSRNRLTQKFAEYVQAERRDILHGELESQADSENIQNAVSTLDQYEDQVIRKAMVAAELDCQHAQQAADDLVMLERLRSLLGYEERASFAENALKLAKIAADCASPYRIVGGLDDWQTNTAVCDINKPFTLTSSILSVHFSGGLSGTYSYAGGPFNATGSGTYSISLPEGLGKPGSMTGGGTGCVDTPMGTVCDGGTEQYSLEPLDPGAACTQ